MQTDETKRFAILRKRLDKFNYTQSLGKESVALVEKILNDLIKASEGY
jgi:centrosomal protein CEP135